MILDDLQPGYSLHFDAPLPKGSGQVESGEFKNSSGVSGLIVPTPPSDWAILKRIFSLPERPERAVSKTFDAEYVPYTDGRIHYQEGNKAVLSAEYSGCLMAVYAASNMRRVAHVPKSAIVKNDCIGEFRDYFADHSTLPAAKKAEHVKPGHEFHHYFQPFVGSRDEGIQYELIGKLILEQMITDPYGFTVFGLVTANDNSCISFWAVKPKRQPAAGEMWHILMARVRAPVEDFKALFDKKNRAAMDIVPN